MKTISIAFYPTIFLLYCFLLPRELFFELIEIKSILGFFGEFIPSFLHFNKNAQYPQLYSFALLIGLLLIPIQIYLFSKSDITDGAKKAPKVNKLKLVSSVLLVISATFFMLFYSMGSNINGLGKYVEIMKFIMGNRVYFSLYISLIYMVLALTLLGAYIQLSKSKS